MSQLIPINEISALKAAGLPFITEHQVRWTERTADDKGLRSAFVRIGRRVFVDPEKFHELARKQSASAEPALGMQPLSQKRDVPCSAAPQVRYAKSKPHRQGSAP